MKTQSCKSKGRKHQQNIRAILLREFPELEEDDILSRGMGSAGIDLMLSPLARRTVGLSIEAKKTRVAPSRTAVDQSKANAYPNTLPVVVWGPQGSGQGKELMICDFADFLKWLKGQQIVSLRQRAMKDVRALKTVLSSKGDGDA